MSMSTDSPAGVTGADATQTTDGGQPIAGSAADASGAAPDAGDASSQDYKGRIRAGGDFAVQEALGHQSRADRMEAENRRLIDSVGGTDGPIGQLAAQGMKPETIKAVVDNYLQLRGNPETQEMILGFEQTGAVANRPDGSPHNDDDEYLSDEQKEIRGLNAKIERLEQGQAGLTRSTGTAALQGHLERFAKENFLRPEEFEELRRGLGPQIDQWGQNKQGLDLLGTMQKPESYDTVETIAWKFTPKNVRFELGDRKRLHDRETVEGFRTDSPADTSTTGKELPADTRHMSALDALMAAKADPRLG